MGDSRSAAQQRLQHTASKSMRLSLVALAAAAALGTMAPPAQALPPMLSKPLRLTPDPRIVDLGVASPSASMSFTVSLKVQNLASLQAFVASVGNPASPNFRQFITPAQFAAQYGQPASVVAQVSSYLTSFGMTVTHVSASNLAISASGTNAQISAAFGTSVHNYSLQGLNYQAAVAAVLPVAWSGIANGVTGLSTRPFMLSNAASLASNPSVAADSLIQPFTATAASIGATNTPGQYTVIDEANKYNVNPLYQAGVTGSGRTVGILTFAGYNQSDVKNYWSAVGVPVSPTRTLTDIAVDGGASANAGPGSSGAGETTLDVEQSGGMAPGANIRVYIAPNTDSGEIDMFQQAVDDNVADTLSISWGLPEIFTSVGTYLQAPLLQAAAEGIPVIAASGDEGAYDANSAGFGFSYPTACSSLLSVDYPASDPMVLAAGGTTLPNAVKHLYGVVTVPTERAWGFDYLQNYIVSNYGQSLYYASYFDEGGGGGVSVINSLPAYQSGLAGVQKSAAAQSLICSPVVAGEFGLTSSNWVDLDDLPSGQAGRNVPDLALNADPYSGFLLYVNGGWQGNWGGTSFVAPQLNGIFTVLASGVTPTTANPKGRLGQLQPTLYALFNQMGYSAASPFYAITAGDNQFYAAGPNYNPATGLGSLNVGNLATVMGVLPATH